MHKRTEKAKNKEKNKKDEVVYLGTQPEHPRDRLRGKVKNTVEKTSKEDEVVYLGTQPSRPEHPRDKFRNKSKKIDLKKRQKMKFFT